MKTSMCLMSVILLAGQTVLAEDPSKNEFIEGREAREKAAKAAGQVVLPACFKPIPSQKKTDIAPVVPKVAPQPAKRKLSPAEQEIQDHIAKANSASGVAQRLERQRSAEEARREEQYLLEMRRQNDELQRLRQAIYSQQQNRNR